MVRHIIAPALMGIVIEMSWNGPRVQWHDGTATMESFDQLQIVWSN